MQTYLALRDRGHTAHESGRIQATPRPLHSYLVNEKDVEIYVARALFAPDVISDLKVKLQPNPFEGVKLKDPGPQRYHSEVGAPNLSATYDYYRCDGTWRALNAWLRSKGIRQQKAIHALRKESGSLVAADFGIEAARPHLGHRDIHTTSAHYVGKKKLVEVNLSRGAGKLKALEVVSSNQPTYL